MRSKHLLVSALSLSLLGLIPALAGCDSLKEKLGMEAKKEEKKDDDKKKKDKDKDEDEDDSDKKEEAKKGDSSASPSAPSAPAGGGGALGAASKSASHLPGDCEVAVTFNLGKVLAHPSFAKSVVPALEDALKKASTSGKDAAKADAFLKDTGIGVKTFTDLALCVKEATGGDPKFAITAAGDLKADTLIPAFEKADPSVSSKIKDIDGRKCISDNEFTMGQLADGSVGFAAGEDLFKAIAPTSDNAVTKYKLDSSKELAFSVSEALVQKGLANGGGGAPPEVKSVKTVSGQIDLTGGSMMIRVGMGSADDAKKLETTVNLLKTQMGSQLAGAPPGTAELLKEATTKIDGNDLLIESKFPSTTVDSLATLLAQGIKSAADEVKLPSGDAKPADPKTAAAAPPAKTVAAPPPPPAKTVAAPPPPPAKTVAKPPPPPKEKVRTKR